MAVCGGTLGIFVAVALQKSGLSVCVLERGQVRGRAQEWNVNPEELRPLVAEEVLTQAQVDAALVSEWPSSRVGVSTGAFATEFEAPALNAGVSPELLIASARENFEAAGGVVFEGAALSSIDVFDDAVIVRSSGDGPRVRAMLLVDAMGANSPIVSQARRGAPPDAACLVVGTMASGYPPEANVRGDYLYSCGPLSPGGYQPFWEAFPAASGGKDGSERSTYFFAYMLPGMTDLPDIMTVFEEYLDALPSYQGVPVEQLNIQRALCASFLAYRDSPLASAFDRVLQVGDAAGIQSPLSFGGFAALCRHLPRVRTAAVEAVDAQLVGREELALLNPYLPNLSLQWAMYRSIARPSRSDPDFVNRVLGGILGAAASCGEAVSAPILQDVFSLSALGSTLIAWFARDPGIMVALPLSMGAENVLAALSHLAALAWYTLLSLWVQPLLAPVVEGLPPRERFLWRRRFEAWRFGSGLDFETHV